MIDFHCHILPFVDDGSDSVKESLELIKMQKSQGITTIVATPHFYANEQSVDNFVIRRDASIKMLQERLPKNAPKILLGAEVNYYEGISKLDELEKLCIEGTNLLLLEMPFKEWTDYSINEVLRLQSSKRVRIVLAHIEKYIKHQKNREVIEEFLTNDILTQSNANFFNRFLTKYKAIKMLKDGTIKVIGTDCHNLDRRPPTMDKATNFISKKLGNGFLRDLSNFQESLLNIK